MSDNIEPTKSKTTEIRRMSEEDLRQFVVDYLANRIFTSANMSADLHLLPNVFMPLIFGMLDSFTEEAVKEIGILWEYLREAGPRATNGYPNFFSVRIMHQLDWERALAAIQREQARQQNLEV